MNIEHECPQCGAPVILDETDRLLSCNFCRVRLYIQAKDFLRYCFVPPDDTPDDTFFIPYWRFRGMHFLCKTNHVEQGLLDKTLLALNQQSFIPSLGLRPQTLKIRLIKPADKWSFLRPQFSFRESYAATEPKVSFKEVAVQKDLSLFESFKIPVTEMVVKQEEVFYEAFIAETLSLLYTPVFIRDSMVFDAILKEPIPNSTYDVILDLQDGNKNTGINFLPVLCPNCGQDMISERDSSILVCNHCDTLWQAETGGFRTVNFAVIEGTKKPVNPFYLPFWRMKISANGIDLRSYADLVRFANMPKTIRQEWEETGLYFWAPALKVPPATFLMLSKQITLSQPGEVFDGSIRGSRSYPVNLPLQEAIESIKITLANIAARKSVFFPRLEHIQIECTDSLLVFYPFQETNAELVQPELRLGIQKNALKLGQNI